MSFPGTFGKDIELEPYSPRSSYWKPKDGVKQDLKKPCRFLLETNKRGKTRRQEALELFSECNNLLVGLTLEFIVEDSRVIYEGKSRGSSNAGPTTTEVIQRYKSITEVVWAEPATFQDDIEVPLTEHHWTATPSSQHNISRWQHRPLPPTQHH